MAHAAGLVDRARAGQPVAGWWNTKAPVWPQKPITSRIGRRGETNHGVHSFSIPSRNRTVPARRSSASPAAPAAPRCRRTAPRTPRARWRPAFARRRHHAALGLHRGQVARQMHPPRAGVEPDRAVVGGVGIDIGLRQPERRENLGGEEIGQVLAADASRGSRPSADSWCRNRPPCPSARAGSSASEPRTASSVRSSGQGAVLARHQRIHRLRPSGPLSEK
jgi:hypothetical protein